MPEDKEEEKKPADIASDDDKHKVVHTDFQTNVEDPKVLERAHKKLVILVVIAIVALIGAVFLFIKGLETPIDTDITEEVATDQSPLAELNGQSVYFSFIEDNKLNGVFHTLGTNIDTPEIISFESLVKSNSDLRNPTWQRSLDGLTVVYQSGTSAGITSNNNTKDNKLIAIVNSQPRELLAGAAINEIADWIMTPNGSKIYVAKTKENYWGSSSAEQSFYKNGTLDLYEIDVTTGEQLLIEKNYNPKVSGSEISPLHYAKNNSLHTVAFESNNKMSHYVNDLSRGESNIRTANYSRKLTGEGAVGLGTISKDGSQVLLASNSNIFLVSLNSNTLRKIYQVPSGYQGLLGTNFVWSPFTNEVAFTIARSSRGEHKVILLETGKTGSRTLITNPPDIDPNPSNNHNLSVVAYSPQEDKLSIISSSKVYYIDLETAKVESAIDIPRNIGNDTASGWIFSSKDTGAEPELTE